jgi:hypothetical protein
MSFTLPIFQHYGTRICKVHVVECGGTFYAIILDALEEAGLANAIIEGEETEFVDESEI